MEITGARLLTIYYLQCCLSRAIKKAQQVQLNTFGNYFPVPGHVRAAKQSKIALASTAEQKIMQQ